MSPPADQPRASSTGRKFRKFEKSWWPATTKPEVRWRERGFVVERARLDRRAKALRARDRAAGVDVDRGIAVGEQVLGVRYAREHEQRQPRSPPRRPPGRALLSRPRGGAAGTGTPPRSTAVAISTDSAAEYTFFVSRNSAVTPAVAHQTSTKYNPAENHPGSASPPVSRRPIVSKRGDIEASVTACTRVAAAAGLGRSLTGRGARGSRPRRRRRR